MSFLFSPFKARAPSPSAPSQAGSELIASSGNQDQPQSDEKIVYSRPDRDTADMKPYDRPGNPADVRRRSDTSTQLVEKPPSASQEGRVYAHPDGQNGNVPPGAQESQASNEKLLVMQKRLLVAEKRAATLQEENHVLKERIGGERGVRNDGGLNVEAQKAEGRIKGLEESNRQKDEQLKALDRRYTQMQKLLEVRTKELSEAQTYLSKPDDHPGSSILKKVEAINSEIFNAATSINDLYENAQKLDLLEMQRNLEFFAMCREISRRMIGERLYRANTQIDKSLEYVDPFTPEEALPLQLALQCLLIRWCTKILGNFGSVPGDGETLAKIYEIIRGREEQSVSARWKVITAGAARQLERSSANEIVNGIMSVLCICGISMITQDFSQVTSRVRKRVDNIERIVVELGHAIHEGITSGDMEVFGVEFDAEYDTRAMKDMYFDGRNASASTRDTVLCTVGLGLRKVVMKPAAETKSIQPHVETMKVPEVVLVSILEGIPPRTYQ